MSVLDFFFLTLVFSFHIQTAIYKKIKKKILIYLSN